MPVPQHRGGLPVTNSPFEGAYSTPTISPGIAGLNIRGAISAIAAEQLTRMSNLQWDQEGSLTSRPGMIEEATSAGTHVHSIARMNDPLSGVATRVWGIDTSVYMGLSGGLSSVQSGFSGDPLSIVPYRPVLSGESWAYIADRSQMKKVSRSGLSLDIGLPTPATGVTTVLGTQNQTMIATGESTDGSEAASWVPHAGTGMASTMTVEDKAGDAVSPAHVYFTTFQASTTDYYQFAALPRTLDLSQVGLTAGTPKEASDKDHIHLWMKTSDPNFLNEVRLYFIVSDDFDATSTLPPGTEVGKNTNSYMKAFRPGDYAAMLSGATTAVSEAAGAAIRGGDEEFLNDLQTNPNFTQSATGGFIDDNGNLVDYDPGVGTPVSRQVAGGPPTQSVQGGSGAHEWVEFGIPGNPLRRGDFKRIGSDTGRNWDTVTGVVLYINAVAGQGVAVGLSDVFLHGGAGQDNSDVGLAGYDYRSTDFDPRTGAESNPSPILATTEPYGLFTSRQPVTLTPAANGDAAIRQRFYRRGGTLGDNWYRLAREESATNENDTNDSDGGTWVDELSDSAISPAETVEIDHAQPVQTVDTNGTIVRAAPVKAMWGPIQDILFACGDIYRPGHLYWSTPGEPDHWSPFSNFEVCGPSEELMNGGYWGSQGFVFSRERLYWIYPNLSADGSITVTPTGCAKGLFSRWGMAVGSRGIFFLNRDGIWVTTGGPPDLLTGVIGDEDDGGIFSNATVNGYAPIDWNQTVDMRLQVWGTELWFQYRDTAGANQHLIYDMEAKRFRHYTFGIDPGTMYVDVLKDGAGSRMILGGRATGDAYTHDGTSDDGAEIAASFRTGAWTAEREREDKLLGDLFVDMDRDLMDITIITYINDETITNPTQTLIAGTDRNRYVVDSFGTTPQRARSVSIDMAWSSGNRRPIVHQLGVSVIQEPEATNLRATQWDDIGSSAEKYLMGVMIECDTFGEDRQVTVEFMKGTTITTAKQFTITHSGRFRHFESWTGVLADRVRIRPDTDCAPWILYECDWVANEKPTRLAIVDSDDENHWDTYSTGLDLSINTFGVAKTFNVYVDGALVTNIATGTTDFSVTATGQQVVHLSWTPLRGHVYRYVATDANDCLLFEHRWHLEAEPSEQTNFNQNFTIANTHADKWIKGVKLECDTFNVAKTVTIEVDGAVAATLTVTADDRSVLQFAFAQVRGRVVRILPTDANPGRLYSASLIFDEEPLQLDRWETQELTLGPLGWKSLLEGWITLRSEDTVNLLMTYMREDGTSTTANVTLPDTVGVKQQHYFTFAANKFVQVKFLFTSASSFWLYKPESELKLADWGAGVRKVSPFGDDNLDLTRGSFVAEQAAGRGGGERR